MPRERAAILNCSLAMICASFVFVAEQLLVGNAAMMQGQACHRRVRCQIDFVGDFHTRRIALDHEQTQSLGSLLTGGKHDQVSVRIVQIDARVLQDRAVGFLTKERL